MDEKLRSLTERQIVRTRQNRDKDFEESLSILAEKAAAEGRFSSSSHLKQILQSCEIELDERLKCVWGIFERVLETAQTPPQNLSDNITQRVEKESDIFRVAFSERIRMTIGRVGGTFDIDTFFLDPASRTVEHLKDEIELFMDRYRPVVSVSDILKAPEYEGPRVHWIKAEAFYRSVPPDLANASKEAVSAVEGMAKIVSHESNLTLGKCVDILRQAGRIPPNLAKTLDGLWGFTSESPGVRHGAISPSNIDEAQAQYVMDISAAVIKYLANLGPIDPQS
jgi:hypothetical protein